MSSILDRVGSALKAATKGGVDSILSSPPSTPSTAAANFSNAVGASGGGMSFLEKYALPASGVAAALVLLLVLRKK